MKYNRVIKDYEGNSITVDVYNVLEAFNVTCPALQHLIKKALCVGVRGHKNTSTDLSDILSSAEKAIALDRARQENLTVNKLIEDLENEDSCITDNQINNT